MSSARQIKLGAIISYITIIFNVITGFFYTPYLVKTLGMSDYGLFTLSASVIAYFTIDFGIGAAITRFIAKYLAENKEFKVKNLLGLTLKLYIIIDLIIFGLLIFVYLFSETIFSNLSSNELMRFQNIFAITASFVLLSFVFLPINGIFIAYEKIYVMKIIDLILKIASVASLVIVLYLGYGLYGVVITSCIVTLSVQIIKFIYLYKKVNLRINIKYKNKELLKKIGSFSGWTSLAMIADKFFFTIIPFLLASFSNTKEIAIFAIVVSIEGYILTFANSLNGLFLPTVMRMVVLKKNRKEMTNLMIKIGRIQLFIVGLLIVGMISLGKEFIYHWLGVDYYKSYYVLVLVLIPCLVHMTQGIANELIFAMNKIKYRALVYVIGSVISVISVVILAPTYGAMGAGIGIFLGFLIAHEIIMNIVYHKVLNLNIVRFFKECHLKILPFLILSGAIGFFLQYYVTTNTFISFIVKGGMWGAIYLIIMWFFAFNKSEKKLIMQPLLKMKTLLLK